MHKSMKKKLSILLSLTLLFTGINYIPNVMADNTVTGCTYSATNLSSWSQNIMNEYFPETTDDNATNLARIDGVTATASSQSDNSHIPQRVVNYKDMDRWESKSDYTEQQWICIDLQSIVSIRTLKIMWETRQACDFNIEISSDGNNYTEIASLNVEKKGNYRTDTIKLNKTYSTRYVRLNLNKNDENNTKDFKIYKIGIYTPGTNDPSEAETTTVPETTTATSQQGNFSYTTEEKNAGGLCPDLLNNSKYSNAVRFNGITMSTATASSNNGDASKTVDYDGGSRWQANKNTNEYLIIDLGKTTSIKAVMIWWEHAMGKDFTIDVSTDGSTYNTVASISEATYYNKNRLDTITLDDYVSARYVRVFVASSIYPNSTWNPSIYDIGIYKDYNSQGEETTTAPEMEFETAVSYEKDTNKRLCPDENNGNKNLVREDGIAHNYISASASSNTNTVYKVIDDLDSERWQASSDKAGEYVIVNLSKKSSIKEVMVWWEVSQATAYEIQISMDGQNYTTIANLKDITKNGQNRIDTITFKKTFFAQYIKILTNANSGNPSIFDIGIYMPGGTGTDKGYIDYVYTPVVEPTYKKAGLFDDKHDGYYNYVRYPNVTATGSSCKPDMDFSKAIDRDYTIDTRWMAQTDKRGESITVDLGTTYMLGEFDIWWERAMAQEYSISYSVDGETYTTLYKNISGKTVGVGVTDAEAPSYDGNTYRKDKIELVNEVKARYVKITGLKSYAWGYSIWDIGIYGHDIEKSDWILAEDKNTSTDTPSFYYHSSDSTTAYKTTGQLYYNKTSVTTPSWGIGYNSIERTGSELKLEISDLNGVKFGDKSNVKIQIAQANSNDTGNDITEEPTGNYSLIDDFTISDSKYLTVDLTKLLKDFPIHSAAGGEMDNQYYYMKIYYNTNSAPDNYISVPLRVKADIPKIEKPENLSVTHDKDTIKVKWNNTDNQNKYGYTYDIYINDTLAKENVVAGTEYAFSGNKETDKPYTVKVIAKWCDQTSEVSSSVTISEEDAGGSWYQINGDSLDVKFKDDNSIFLGATIYYYKENGDNADTTNITAKNGAMVISGKSDYYTENTTLSLSGDSLHEMYTEEDAKVIFSDLSDISDRQSGNITIKSKTTFSVNNKTTYFLLKVKNSENTTVIPIKVTVDTTDYVDIYGFQMNTNTDKGGVAEFSPSFRVISKVSKVMSSDDGVLHKVTNKGTLYALKGSENYTYGIADGMDGVNEQIATDKGIVKVTEEDNGHPDSYTYYAISFKYTAYSFTILTTDMIFRACAEYENNGKTQRVYGERNPSTQMYDISQKLYDGKLMGSEATHNYLYNNVLNIVTTQKNRSKMAKKMLSFFEITKASDPYYVTVNTAYKDLYNYVYCKGGYSYPHTDAFKSLTDNNEDTLLNAIADKNSSGSSFTTVESWIDSISEENEGFYKKVTYDIEKSDLIR